MQLVINGRVVDLPGFLNPRTGQVDARTEGAVRQLFGAFLAGQVYDLDQFIVEVQAFFDAHVGNAEAHDRFFGTVRALWELLRSGGREREAERLWELALAAAARWEATNPESQPVHKGVPYYFYGAHCLLRGDLDYGYALMHQALSEDIRRHARELGRAEGGEPLPATPARAFVALDWSHGVQPFREWIRLQANYIEQRMQGYRGSLGRSIDLNAFRVQFPQQVTRPDVLYVLAYTVARLMSMQEGRHRPNSPYAVGNPFVGQLDAGMCFDLLLVLDNAIKDRRPALSRAQPIELAAEVARTAGLSLTRSELAEINGAFGRDREGVLGALLNRAQSLSGGRVLSAPEADLALAYALRNDAAHDLGSIETLWRRFPEVEQSLFNVLFLVAEHLYGAVAEDPRDNSGLEAGQ